MKLRLAIGFAPIFFSVVLLVHSQSHRITAGEGRVLALETAWNHAEQNKDVAALDQLLAPQLVNVDYDGSIATKQEYLASVKSEGLEPEQIVTRSRTCTFSGTARWSPGFITKKA